MATQLVPEAPFTYRSSPTAIDAYEAWLAANPQARPVHTQPWDVSRSDIYVEDRWGPIFAEMRAKAPVNKVTSTPYGDYWNIVSHKAIQHVESLPELFSSSWQHGGITIGDPPEGTDPAKLAERQMPMFIAMDRPEHTGQRRTVAPAFIPTEMQRMEAEIRARTSEVLDSLPWGERFDWVDKVSIELTTGMLAILFGFPWHDRRLLTFWSDWAGDVELTLAPELSDQRFEILSEMARYFQGLWMQRIGAAPTPDLISMMIHSPAMATMSPLEFMGNLVLLIVGGNDTTRNTMSGIIHALDQFPDQRTLLEGNTALIPNAVQECLRFVTPLAHMRRTATADSELFGQHIKAGDKVVMWYLSANRDEDAIEQADTFIIDRARPRQHISFGFGIHRCVGNRLAELQLKILWEEILERFPRIELAGEPRRLYSNFIHGFTSLPVRIPG
jgi:hypothetical protein